MTKVFEERAITALAELGLVTARLHLDQVAQQAAAEEWSYTHFLGYLQRRRAKGKAPANGRDELAVCPLSLPETD